MTIARRGGSPGAGSGTGWQERPGWSTGSRRMRAAGRYRPWFGTDPQCGGSHGRSMHRIAWQVPGAVATASHRVPPAMPIDTEGAFELRRRPISERSSELQQHTEAEAATIHPVAKPRDRTKEADAARAGRRDILHRVVCTGTPPRACRCCAFCFPEFISSGLPDHESRPHIGRRTRFRACCRGVATSACRCATSACETAARAWQRNKHSSCVVASLQSREGSRCRECSRANA